MLCTTCRRAILSRIRSPASFRTVATVPSTPNAPPANPPPPTTDKTPATSSSTPGISQPLSTEMLSSTSTAKSSALTSTPDLRRAKLQGSIPGGQELKGIAYLKNKPQILALEDDEYPPWLWTLLEENKPKDGIAAVDLAAMTKKQRAKHDRKQAKLMRDVVKPVPVHEQSKDLTQIGDDANVSLQRRQEITKSSREARRKGIRESNFLKGM